MRLVFSVVVAMVVLTGWTASARAQSSDKEAETLIRRGIELRKVRDDEGAVRLFQKAYDLARTPRAAAQLGLAEQALGRWEFAEIHVLEAIRATNDPWIVKNRAALESAVEVIGQHIGRIEVIGDPPGAELSVNGRASGRLPLADPVHVSAGQVDLELRAPGHVSAHRTVTIVGGQYQRVVLRLTKEAAPVPATAGGANPSPRNAEADSAGAVATTAAPVEAPTGPSPEPAANVDGTTADPGSSRAFAIGKWSAAGGAALALTVGIIASVVHEQRSSAFERNMNCANKGGTAVHVADGSPAPECQGDLDAFHTARTWQIVGFVGAGALAATWVALTLLEPRPGPQTQQAFRPICAPSLLGIELTCRVLF